MPAQAGPKGTYAPSMDAVTEVSVQQGVDRRVVAEARSSTIAHSRTSSNRHACSASG